MAISLLKNNIRNFVILEKSAGLGGTWKDNKYPGCCCDGMAVCLLPGRSLLTVSSLLASLQFLVCAEPRLDQVISLAGRDIGMVHCST